MRAVVTGGAGFIGSHLIEALVARGDDVVCIERPGGGAGWVRNQRIDFAPIGLENADALRGALEGAEVVFHLAALTEARTPSDFYTVNADGTRRVLQAAAAQGLSDVQAYLPPQVARSFGRRLERMGWRRDPWTCYTRALP